MSKLYFYYSVMGGGKTTSLLQTEYNYAKQGFKPLIIKPKLDDREGQQNGFGPIKSRILTGKHQALYIDSVSPETLQGIDFNILLVDEVQFFKPADIVALSDIADTQHIPVVCYGLKTDANGHLFEGSAKLLAIADSIKEIKCICPCGAKATMHVRYVDGRVDTNPKPYAIEKGNITYESVCRKCYKRIKGLER